VSAARPSSRSRTFPEGCGNVRSVRFTRGTCGCRKLVRARDLRLWPSGGHGLIDLRNCAINPKSSSRGGVRAPLATARPVASRSNRFAVFVAFAIRSFEGLQRTRGRRAASRRIRSGRAKRLLSMPGRVFGTHRFAVGSGRSTAATSAACKASVAETRSARAKWGRHMLASRPTFGPDAASLLAL
jgi:hypothetical protein